MCLVFFGDFAGFFDIAIIEKPFSFGNAASIGGGVGLDNELGRRMPLGILSSIRPSFTKRTSDRLTLA